MNQMIVYCKETDEKVTVYDITYDKSGYPHFLIFKDNQWLIVSAKHFHTGKPLVIENVKMPVLREDYHER